MAERKPIGKKMRFEVFKRDKFTCQYCGRMAPDVILEVDHIKPVAEGGNNGIMNLITSCRDCNRGKGKRTLAVNEEVKKQQGMMQELAEKREQLELLLKWRTELTQFEQSQAEAINDYIGTVSGYMANDRGLNDIRKWLREFSFEEIITAIDISYSKYFHGYKASWEIAFKKIGGVCYNRRKQGDV